MIRTYRTNHDKPYQHGSCEFPQDLMPRTRSTRDNRPLSCDRLQKPAVRSVLTKEEVQTMGYVYLSTTHNYRATDSKPDTRPIPGSKAGCGSVPRLPHTEDRKPVTRALQGIGIGRCGVVGGLSDQG